MSKYTGWVIEKSYYKVEVEADSWEEAYDKICQANVSGEKPDGQETEIHDVGEVK